MSDVHPPRRFTEQMRQHVEWLTHNRRLMAGEYRDAPRGPQPCAAATEPPRPARAAILSLTDGRRISGAAIISAVAHAHRISIPQLKGRHQWPADVHARAHAAYLMRTLRPDLSTTIIGRMLGGRDHSTVIHMYKDIWPRIASRWEDKVSFSQMEKNECQTSQ